MHGLNKEKLKELKKSKNYTSNDISQKTGIPKSTIEKIFGGFNKNPTIESLQKIANALDCGLDDFLEYEQEPVSPFYADRIIAKLVNYLYEKPELKSLIENAKTLSTQDINLLIEIARRLHDNKSVS